MPHVEPIVKKYLELRYRMLPYTSTRLRASAAIQGFR